MSCLVGDSRRPIFSWRGSNTVCTIPLFKLGVDDPVGEALPTDTDTLEHTVTLKLVKNEVGINHTWLLQFVGDDTADEMRMCRVQALHQFVEGFLKSMNMCISWCTLSVRYSMISW